MSGLKCAAATAACAALCLSAAPGHASERARYDLALAMSERRGPEFAVLAIEELTRYERAYPDGRFLDDAHYRLGRAEETLGKSERQALRLLKVVLVDPGSLREPLAREELDRLLKRERKLRGLEERFAQSITRFRLPDAPIAERRLGYVRALFLIDEPESVDLSRQAALEFFELHSDSEAAPDVAFSLSDLERRRGDARRAIGALDRVVTLGPEEPRFARALLEQGEVLAEDLRAYVEAHRVYERVAREAPGSVQAATAWLRMGLLERDRHKRPEIALRDFDEVATRYPEHPDAFVARVEKAETLRVALRDPSGAEGELLATADRYPQHSRAPEVLLRAARVADRDRKDPIQAAAHYERLAESYPSFESAPEALFRAAELLEKAGAPERAARLYSETSRRYPESKLAGRAAKRAERLAGSDPRG